jgi:outer membrane protein TolC
MVNLGCRFFYLIIFIYCMGVGNLKAEGMMTLAEVFKRIERENLQVLLNRESIEQALSQVEVTRSGFFPSVGLEFSQSRQQSTFNNSGSLGSGVGQTGVYNDMHARIKGEVKLIDFRQMNDYRAAKIGQSIARSSYETLVQAILYEAAKAYYAHVRNIKRNDLMKSRLEADRLLVERLRIEFGEGTASRLDLLSAESALAMSEQASLSQQLVIERSEIYLKQLLNIGLNDQLDIDIQALDTVCMEAPEERVLLQDIFLKRADMREQETLISLSKAEIARAQSGHYPVVKLGGSRGYQSERVLDGNQRSNWSVGVNVTMPVFEGFRVQSEVMNAQAQARARMFARDDLRQKVEKECMLAHEEIQNASKQLALSKSKLLQAEQQLSYTDYQLSSGVVNKQAFLNARLGNAEAIDTYLEIKYSYCLAMIYRAYVEGDIRKIVK